MNGALVPGKTPIVVRSLHEGEDGLYVMDRTIVKIKKKMPSPDRFKIPEEAESFKLTPLREMFKKEW